jgi:hypothetical protein
MVARARRSTQILLQFRLDVHRAVGIDGDAKEVRNAADGAIFHILLMATLADIDDRDDLFSAMLADVVPFGLAEPVGIGRWLQRIPSDHFSPLIFQKDLACPIESIQRLRVGQTMVGSNFQELLSGAAASLEEFHRVFEWDHVILLRMEDQRPLWQHRKAAKPSPSWTEQHTG